MSETIFFSISCNVTEYFLIVHVINYTFNSLIILNGNTKLYKNMFSKLQTIQFDSFHVVIGGRSDGRTERRLLVLCIYIIMNNRTKGIEIGKALYVFFFFFN